MSSRRQHSSVAEPQLSRDAQTRLDECVARLRPFPSARLLWSRVLTETERKQLGGDLDTAFHACHGTIGIWRALHGVTADVAAVQAAQAANLLNNMDAQWLLRELGYATVPSGTPAWNAETGELTWGGQIIRNVRLMARPSNIQLLLDVFQEEYWPPSIDNPLTGAEAASKLREAVRTLNQGLSFIQFHSAQNGQRCSWNSAEVALETR